MEPPTTQASTASESLPSQASAFSPSAHPRGAFARPGRICSWCHPIFTVSVIFPRVCSLFSEMINKKQILHIGISATNLSHFRVRKSLSILLSFNAGITAAATRISFTWRLTNPFQKKPHTVFHQPAALCDVTSDVLSLIIDFRIFTLMV